jgi:pimeloyl-ACP methyl ester carboxylesterase
MNIDLEHRLAEIYIPTLIVVGEKDSIYPVALSRTMHEKISGARLEIIEGANHVLILNNIEETAQQVIGFVREVHVGVVQ